MGVMYVNNLCTGKKCHRYLAVTPYAPKTYTIYKEIDIHWDREREREREKNEKKEHKQTNKQVRSQMYSLVAGIKYLRVAS